jgi:hypothetical protein
MNKTAQRHPSSGSARTALMEIDAPEAEQPQLEIKDSESNFKNYSVGSTTSVHSESVSLLLL